MCCLMATNAKPDSSKEEIKWWSPLFWIQIHFHFWALQIIVLNIINLRFSWTTALPLIFNHRFMLQIKRWWLPKTGSVCLINCFVTDGTKHPQWLQSGNSGKSPEVLSSRPLLLVYHPKCPPLTFYKLSFTPNVQTTIYIGTHNSFKFSHFTAKNTLIVAWYVFFGYLC